MYNFEVNMSHALDGDTSEDFLPSLLSYDVYDEDSEDENTYEPDLFDQYGADVEGSSSSTTVFDDGENFDVFEMSSSIEDNFHGACVDTGAQRSIVGRLQAEAYCEFVCIPFEFKNAKRQNAGFTSLANNGSGELDLSRF